MKNKAVFFFILIIIVVTMAAFFIFSNKEFDKKTSGLLGTINAYQGYTRVISQEEYDFYKYFVERDLPDEVSEEELDKLVKEYAGKVNAAFYLGNKLGFCEPYSLSTLQFRMEQENAERQVKLEQGEVVYGLEQFTLQTYFQYTMDNLETFLQGYLEENADEEILKMSEDYYEAHKEDFRYIKEVVYEQTLDDVTETLTADADTLSYLGKSDAGLADFLGDAEVGDTYEDDKNAQKRTVVLKDITYSEEGYENNSYMALYLLVRNELYETVIEKVAENNPVEFE